VAATLALGAIGLTVALVLLGLALTHLSETGVLRRWDLSVDRWLAGQRTSGLDTLTRFGNEVANTPTVVLVGLVMFFVVRAWLGRWYESCVLAVALVGEVAVFLTVAAAVHRPRPDVPRLDQAPPTSSFPSGHTMAAVVLYGCLAVLLVRYATSGLALPVAALLWLVPLGVAASRLYRGMHYPTDVLAGALAGAVWLLVVVHTMLPARPAGSRRRTA
jgi:undecaprenyl-diphosphatase